MKSPRPICYGDVTGVSEGCLRIDRLRLRRDSEDTNPGDPIRERPGDRHDDLISSRESRAIKFT